MPDSLRAVRAGILEQRLSDAARPSGGWGYFEGKQSRVEPTCWALAALAGCWNESPAAWAAFAAPHLQFLAACQRSSGFLTDLPELPPNLAANGLVAWLMASEAAVGGPQREALISSIIGLKGVTAAAGDPRQDNSLQAWPWMPGTFSWVEPTAWCLLGLKTNPRFAASPQARARILEAERLLDNRCCDIGGWNYGNASALGQDLRPHVPPTALALLALQNRRDQRSVAKSLAFLEHARLSEQSGLALGLTTLCLHVYGQQTIDVLEQLAAVSEQTNALGNLHAIAVALSALTLDRHDGKAFRVSS